MTASASYFGAAALLAENLDSLVLAGVRDVHTSVAGRVHKVTDHVGGGFEHRAHDLIAGAVYGSIGVGVRGAGRALHAADRAGVGVGVEESRGGRAVLAAINGLIGDELRDGSSSMFYEATFRADGHDLGLDPAALAAAYPAASDSLVVFVHGLCENDESWARASRPRREDGTSAPTYGERLEADHGWTPVALRYNSGLPIAENGIALNALLARLVDNWPTPVKRVAMVGHSMGGLVIRSSLAVRSPTSWHPLVTDVVCLGTPHLGAPLERVVAWGVPKLQRVGEVAPIARVLERRAQGIIDLRHGIGPHIVDAQPRFHLVAATLTRSARHPVALAIGDLLVQPRSAMGTPRRASAYFPESNVVHLPSAGHLDLLNHDDVYIALAGWLVRK